MIRVYCDSNVYRYLKPSYIHFNKEWYDCFQNIRSNCVLIFSEAHLDDLRTSDEIHREEDLTFMMTYTGDCYLPYNQITKTWTCDLMTPLAAFKSQNYAAYDKAIANPFDVVEILKEFEGFGDLPGGNILSCMVTNLLSTPISALGHSAPSPILQEEDKHLMNRMIPGYNVDMTLGQLWSSMQPYLTALLKDSKELNDLRKNVVAKVDPNQYTFKKWGMDFNTQISKTAIGRSFADMLQIMVNDGNKDDLWIRFFHAYAMLEVLNITVEKAGKGRKKNSLLDLSKDCSHAFNAMSCDYLITNDRGLYEKANILYEWFKHDRTEVLMLDDVTSFSMSNVNEDSFGGLISQLKSLDCIVKETENYTTFRMKSSFLHYFDLVARRKYDESYVFYSGKDEGRNFIFREIQFICNKIIAMLTPNVKDEDFVTIEELRAANELTALAEWQFPNMRILLIVSFENRSLMLEMKMVAPVNTYPDLH